MRKSKLVLSQLDAAAAVLMTLRWGVDHCLVDEDLDPFVGIVRAMMPTARAALESVVESRAQSHVRAALGELNQLEWLVAPQLPDASFDRLIAIADPLIGRAQAAIEAAQARLRKKPRRVSH